MKLKATVIWGFLAAGLIPVVLKHADAVAALTGCAMFLAVSWLLLNAWLEERRVRYRRRFGLCTRCGYDLRESHKRCPECGLVAPMIERNYPGEAETFIKITSEK